MAYDIDKRELKQLFDKKFHSVLKELEPYRKKKQTANQAQKGLFIGGIVVMMLMGVFMFTGSSIMSSNIFYVMFALPFIFFVSRQFFSSGKKQDWVKRYKSEIAEPLVHFIDADLVYSPSKGISRDTYTSCGMFRSDLYSYASEDLIEGKRGNINFRFSEVHGKYESRDSDGDRTIHTDFEGVLMVCDFNKRFKGEYVLSSDLRDTTWIGKLMDTITHNASVIKLDDPEFEKLFDLRGTDQIEGRYIFSHTFMENVKQLRNDFRVVRLAFKKDQLYIALGDHFDLLNHDFSLQATDYSNIELTVDRICSIVAVIDTLNLNLDIWKNMDGA